MAAAAVGVTGSAVTAPTAAAPAPTRFEHQTEIGAVYGYRALAELRAQGYPVLDAGRCVIPTSATPMSRTKCVRGGWHLHRDGQRHQDRLL